MFFAMIGVWAKRLELCAGFKTISLKNVEAGCCAEKLNSVH